MSLISKNAIKIISKNYPNNTGVRIEKFGNTDKYYGVLVLIKEGYLSITILDTMPFLFETYNETLAAIDGAAKLIKSLK